MPGFMVLVGAMMATDTPKMVGERSRLFQRGGEVERNMILGTMTLGERVLVKINNRFCGS